MYQPMFTLDAKGIPIISNDEIDTLGERLVADFSPLDIFTPKAIDIDRFVTKYLKSRPYGWTTGSAGGLDKPLQGIFRYRL